MPEFQLEAMDDFCADDLRQNAEEYEKKNPLTEEEIKEIQSFAVNFLNKAKKAANLGLYSCTFEVLRRPLFVNTFVQYIKNHEYRTVVTEEEYTGYNKHLYPHVYTIKIYWGNI